MKNVPENFLKPYNPEEVEEKIYQKWMDSGYFNPDNLKSENILKDENGKEKVFSIVLPPPNVTGTLHTGHSLMLSIQDVVIRFQRMTGKRALWLPGTDHAAIATQSVVEKKIGIHAATFEQRSEWSKETQSKRDKTTVKQIA